MSADMRPGGTMRLSNPLTSSLMRSLLPDRKHVRCYLSRLMEMDLPLFRLFRFQAAESHFRVKSQVVFQSRRALSDLMSLHWTRGETSRLVFCGGKLSYCYIVHHCPSVEKEKLCSPAHVMSYRAALLNFLNFTTFDTADRYWRH